MKSRSKLVAEVRGLLRQHAVAEEREDVRVLALEPQLELGVVLLELIGVGHRVLLGASGRRIIARPRSLARGMASGSGRRSAGCSARVERGGQVGQRGGRRAGRGPGRGRAAGRRAKRRSARRGWGTSRRSSRQAPPSHRSRSQSMARGPKRTPPGSRPSSASIRLAASKQLRAAPGRLRDARGGVEEGRLVHDVAGSRLVDGAHGLAPAPPRRRATRGRPRAPPGGRRGSPPGRASSAPQGAGAVKGDGRLAHDLRQRDVRLAHRHRDRAGPLLLEGPRRR